MAEETRLGKMYSVFFRQEYPADLKLVVVWLAACITAIYIPVLNQSPVRVILGLPILLFIPGYSLISALFPKEGDLDLITRIALSIGLSIAVLPLIGLGLNFTPWGIRLDPIIISLSIFTLVLVLVAHYTRAVLPVQERFSIPFSAVAQAVREEILPERISSKRDRIDRVLSAALVLGILIAVMVTVFVLSVPREGEQFTEFFILDENRTATHYPDLVLPGQNYPMYVGITNHENRDTRYTIETWVIRTEFDNLTNTSRMVAMDPKDRLLLSLTHNETRLIPYNLSVKKTGYNRVEFLLFNEAVPGFEVTGNDRINASYRNLHLVFSSETEREEEDTTE